MRIKLSKNKECANANNPLVIWFTGLSGSGKSTLAGLLNNEFEKKEISCYVLDGDILRQGLNKDLDFTISGRRESVRRAVEVCKLMIDAGITVIVSLISPIEVERLIARDIIGAQRFFLVYISCHSMFVRAGTPKICIRKLGRVR